ncbi:MAG: hypothetical protein QF440_02260, partial [Candidatus Thalassarchaeaceae archaeon]|nr:hypothetical protein [Candidatus Thalassarchaeaceae archaeon]
MLSQRIEGVDSSRSDGMRMSEEDLDSIEDIFAKEMAAKLAARAEMEQDESIPDAPDEPENVSDAFAIGVSNHMPVLSPEPVFPSNVPYGEPISPLTSAHPKVDPLLTPLGPPASPPMDAMPPGPPPSQPQKAPPA